MTREDQLKHKIKEAAKLVVLCLLMILFGFIVSDGFVTRHFMEKRDYVTFEIKTAYMTVDTHGRFYMTAQELVMEPGKK